MEKVDPDIKVISDIRREIRPLIEQPLKNLIRCYKDSYRHKLNTIVDALVYLSLSHYKSIQDYNPKNDRVLEALKNKEFCYKLVNNLQNKTINFENSLNASLQAFNIPNHRIFDMQRLIHHKDLDSKPDIRLAIQMYLLKGNFFWANDENSKFKDYVCNSERERLESNTYINCWDAVFYGMVKSGIITKQYLQKYYSGNLDENECAVNKWFDYPNQTLISANSASYPRWREILKTDPHFIMIDNMAHTMVSIPYSQKQLLKMMITRKFDEKPSKAKIYSLWAKWTGFSLGTVSKIEMEKQLQATAFSTVRVSRLQEFVARGRTNSDRNGQSIGRY